MFTKRNKHMRKIHAVSLTPAQNPDLNELDPEFISFFYQI